MFLGKWLYKMLQDFGTESRTWKKAVRQTKGPGTLRSMPSFREKAIEVSSSLRDTNDTKCFHDP